MPDITSSVVAAAQRLYQQKTDDELELLIGMLENAMQRNPSLRDNVDFEPQYEQAMGLFPDLRALGRRILTRWTKELYDLFCGARSDKDRQLLFDSLRLNEAAVVAAIAVALLSHGVAPIIAAALAPLIVKRFIWPCKDELCKGWAKIIDRG